jgi:LAO/AO transport system kinase
MSKQKQFKGEVEESKLENSALIVNEGIEQPPQVNPNIYKIRHRKNILPADDYVKGIINGNINILSQAITLIESSLPEHNLLAQQIIEKCLNHSGKSIRIGITGVPGVGKSTFIEALGMEIVNSGNKLAVLAIDPSSEKSKGSILGDKTRMERLATHQNAFIRPSPSAGSLGGVARKTRETVILCEAAGFNTIFIETVGVGQSETSVHSMVDFFLLLMLAGAGDELQGIKRGIMEMSDAIAITKADSSNVIKANLAKAQYQNALHLFPPTESGWTPKVLTCSALENTGILAVWELINDYISQTSENEYFEKNRNKQSLYWMYETINEAIKKNFYCSDAIKEKLKTIEKDILDNKVSSFKAAKILLDLYFG